MPIIYVWLIFAIIFVIMVESISSSSLNYYFSESVVFHEGLLTHKYTLLRNGIPQTFFQFLAQLSDQESSIHSVFYEILRSFPTEAYFWECPATSTLSWRSQTFEFVLIDARNLAKRSVNPSPFSEKFASYAEGSAVISFLSLGRDAMLVVPTTVLTADTSKHAIQYYTHLASFMRLGNPSQISALWQRVALEVTEILMNDRSEPRLVWVSTSGLGVSWLHVRLDSVPKYYNWKEYKSMHLK